MEGAALGNKDSVRSLAVTCDSSAHRAQPTWLQTCERVRFIAARLRGKRPALVDREMAPLVEELVAVVDGGDPLVAFLALETLCEALARVREPAMASMWVRRILQQSTSGDPTARFQLLRQLIRVRGDNRTPEAQEDGAKSEKGEDDEEDEEEDSSGDETTGAPSDRSNWFLAATLEALASYGHLLDSVLADLEGRWHVVHEGIVCLTDIVKRAPPTARDTTMLREVVEQTVNRAQSWQFGGAAPTFVACDILDLAVDSRGLYHPEDDIEPQSSWIALATAIFKSPLSALALEVLNASVSSSEQCTESFISRTSGYPLVQKWIHLCCLTASDLLSRSATDRPKEWHAPPSDLQLPTRTRLLDVLTEQDDILIDVVVELLGIARCLDDPSTYAPAVATLYFENELHPDLVFAELLRAFGDDHLVVLDMLMSSETRMLEYLLQYLRQATTLWPRAEQAWKRIQRTERVMSVLIRLRLEMERLVETGVFPYNPRPLVRRLEALEHLYENGES